MPQKCQQVLGILIKDDHFANAVFTVQHKAPRISVLSTFCFG